MEFFWCTLLNKDLYNIKYKNNSFYLHKERTSVHRNSKNLQTAPRIKIHQYRYIWIALKAAHAHVWMFDVISFAWCLNGVCSFFLCESHATWNSLWLLLLIERPHHTTLYFPPPLLRNKTLYISVCISMWECTNTYAMLWPFFIGIIAKCHSLRLLCGFCFTSTFYNKIFSKLHWLQYLLNWTPTRAQIDELIFNVFLVFVGVCSWF